MEKKLTNKVSWVGKVDWELKQFHGNEFSVRKGSSYNSYLIRDQKTVLIDTVWQPFDREFVARLKQSVDLQSIDYIISLHAEVDHSGALPELLREIPNTPIYCSRKGADTLKAHYHEDWNFIVVKTGDILDLGEHQLVFVEAAMLHWPDTMFAYLTGESILFSNDAFGQHYATESLYNDIVDQCELYAEALKYYANILTPFGPLVTRKIKEVLALQLPVSMIAPSHGVIWKHDPAQIITKYLEWADNYQENQITLVYDTMWNATRQMAEAIAEGIQLADSDVTIKLINAAKEDKNDVINEVFKAKGILLGSSCINSGYLHSIAGILEMVRGMKFKNKKAAAFGSYGWSGEMVGQLSEGLKTCGFTLVNDGYRSQWLPNEEERQKLIAYGKEIAQAMK